MNQAQRVFMIGWEYPPHNSGGLGVACEGLTQALAGQNTQIYFTLPYTLSGSVDHMNVLTCANPNWGSQTQPPFLAYSSLKSGQDRVTAADLASLPSTELEQRVVEYAELVQTQAQQQPNQFEVIHAHDWMSFPAAMQVKQQTSKPFIAHIHSTEFDRIPGGGGSPYITQTEQAGLEAADHVITVSYYTKRLLIDKYGVAQDKISVIHNGVPTQGFSKRVAQPEFASGRPVIVFMGRLTMQKGVEYFLAVAKQVVKTLPQALFVVAGDGDMYHELLFKAASDRLSATVMFSGYVRDRQRSMLLDRADVFIMPSISEPFGLVALEAAARHTSVIVSKNAGVAEVLPSALQLDFWDVDRMAQVVCELVTNKKMARTQIKHQLQELKRVSWESAAQRVKRVYRQTFLGR